MEKKLCFAHAKCWYKILFDLLIFVLVMTYIFSYTRFAFAKVYLYPLKFVLFSFVFAWVLSTILIKKKALRLSKHAGSASFFFLVWIIAMLLSLYRTNYLISGSLLIISYVLMFLLSFVLFPNSPNNKNVYLWFQVVFFWGTLIALIVSVLLSVGNPESFYIVANRIRYQAIFTKPNYLALFSFTGFMVSVGVFALSNRKKYLLPIPFYLVLIYFSNTRTPLFLIAVFLIILLYLLMYLRISNRAKKMLLNIFLLFSLGLIIVGLVYAINYFPFMSMSSINKLSSNRLTIWVQAISNINSYELVFGRGLGSEQLSALSYDNYYINIFVQTGLFGLFSFLLFIFYIFYWFWKKLDYYGFSRIFLVQFSMFITFLLYSFFESILFSLGSIASIYIWMNVGFLINNTKGAVDYQKLVPHVPVVAKNHKFV